MPDRILVAFDESSQAEAALRHTLATYPDAEIVVLHVNDPVEWIVGDGMNYGYYSQADFERAQATAEDVIETAEAIAAEYDQAVTGVVQVGSVAATIVDYAEADAVDLVVVGSHGRRGLARFLLGSVAEAVVRRSSVSVTVVREPVEGGSDG